MPAGPLKNILILKDSRPGHYNQSEGIAKALGRVYEVEIERIPVPQKGLLPQRSLRWLLGQKWLPQFVLELLSLSFRIRPSRTPDLVVSAGGSTMVPNVLLARRHRCPNVYSGQIRNIAASEFSLFLNALPSFKKYQNCIVTLKPSPVDLRNIVAKPNCPDHYHALLVGGPTSKHLFTDEEWQGLVRWLERDDTRNWVVTTSRRTPAKWVSDLRALAHQQSERITLFDYTLTGPGDAIAIAYGAAAVFVTCDSDSMISEAIACRKPVISLQAEELKITRDDREYIAWMADNEWVHFTKISDLKNFNMDRALDSITPLTTDHLDQLAGLISQKLTL